MKGWAVKINRNGKGKSEKKKLKLIYGLENK